MGTKSRKKGMKLMGIKIPWSWRDSATKALRNAGVHILGQNWMDGSAAWGYVIATTLSLSELQEKLEQYGLGYLESFDPADYCEEEELFEVQEACEGGWLDDLLNYNLININIQ